MFELRSYIPHSIGLYLNLPKCREHPPEELREGRMKCVILRIWAKLSRSPPNENQGAAVGKGPIAYAVVARNRMLIS
jgi:hypothetical protein